jgi:hypothetical protein
MGKKHHDEEMVICPVGRFFMDLEKASAKKSKFFEHLDRSRVEFLKALRSLLDESIEHLEKRERSGRGKKATKIDIEEQ